MNLARFLSILLFFLCSCIEAQRVLNIGVMYSGSGIFKTYGDTVPLNAEMWKSKQIEQGGIAKTGIFPNVIYANVQSNTTLTGILTKDLIQNQHVQIIVAPEAFLTGIVAGIASTFKIPVIAGMSASTDVFVKTDGSRKYSNLFGCMTPSLKYFGTLLQLAKIREMSKVAILWSNVSPDNDVCRGAVIDANNIQMNVLDARPVVSTATIQQWQEHVQEIAALKPDTLIVCNKAMCSETLSALADINYTPKILSMFECAGTISAIKSKVGTQAKHFVTPVQWDYRLRGKQFTDSANRPFANLFVLNYGDNSSSAQLFFKNMTQAARPGQILTSLIAPQMAAFYQLAYAVHDCNCTNSGGLLNGLARVSTPSFFGKIGMDDLGQNDAKEIVLVQIDNDYVAQIIAPLESATMTPNFPIPTWAEREVANLDQMDSSYMAVLIVAIFLSINAILLVAYIYKNRKTKTIKATSYRFSIVSLFGLVLGVFSPLTWALTDTGTTCGARIPLFILGFIVTFSPLIAKTVRIARIFHQTTIRARKIEDKHVAIYALVLSLPLLILCVIWIGLNPIVPTVKTLDILRPLYSYTECQFVSSEAARIGNIIIICFLVCGGLMLVVGSAIAFYARHAQAEFNDAHSIKWSVYIFTVLIGLTIVVTYSFNDSNRQAAFLLRSFCIQFSFASSMAILFFERIFTTVMEKNGQFKFSSGHNNTVLNMTIPRSNDKKLHSDFKSDYKSTEKDKEKENPEKSEKDKDKDKSDKDKRPLVYKSHQRASTSQQLDSPVAVKAAF